MPRLLYLVLTVLLGSMSVSAQDEPIEIPTRPSGADARMFYAVYDIDSPVFEAWMRTANGISAPTFLAAVPMHGLGVLATGESGGPVGQMALSQVGTLGAVFVGKTLIGRARPFRALPGVESRQRREPGGVDPYSFPSGHSAIAFTLATSASLSYPEWYVIVPAYLWASSTALARVWFGMHYPSDIVVGAAVGTGVALLVHAILDDGGSNPDGLPQTTAPVLTFSIPLH